MVAALTPLPVIGVPVKPAGAHLDGLDALLSIVQVIPSRLDSLLGAPSRAHLSSPAHAPGRTALFTSCLLSHPVPCFRIIVRVKDVVRPLVAPAWQVPPRSFVCWPKTTSGTSMWNVFWQYRKLKRPNSAAGA